MDTHQITEQIIERLNDWFSLEQQTKIVEQLTQRVGLTRIRAEYFVKLWVYLLAKQQVIKQQARQAKGKIEQQSGQLNPSRTPATKVEPIETLTQLTSAVSCSHSEAARLFYGDKDQGSDRAAGMMLDKLAALGLIKKHFDGNTTRIEIQMNPETLQDNAQLATPTAPLQLDDFDPRCDAVPVANLLAINYGWMNRTLEIVPHRITRLLRRWASQYPTGMRVLRRTDNLNPVGFYLMYPTAAESEVTFSSSPTKGLHLASLNEVDPFTMATPGDPECTAVFIRSWMIDPLYLDQYRALFLQDAQTILQKMQQDFPNLCDLHTLIIHPSYEAMANALGFQKMGLQTSRDTQLYWMYQALDRYLALDIAEIFKAKR
ncbi:MAG: hypothetical protein AAGC93_13915 [Cyanobacteria bacterium P01_F01_bin.53]